MNRGSADRITELSITIHRDEKMIARRSMYCLNEVSPIRGEEVSEGSEGRDPGRKKSIMEGSQI